MSKHTPGPWYAVGYWVEHGDSVADICTCDPAAIEQEHLGRTSAEIEANARLIAAAPDLLEALKSMPQSMAATDDDLMRWVEKARAAIAKATGDAQ